MATAAAGPATSQRFFQNFSDALIDEDPPPPPGDVRDERAYFCFLHSRLSRLLPAPPDWDPGSCRCCVSAPVLRFSVSVLCPTVCSEDEL
ncbi:protein SGT1 homolog [Saimiri boliviensis]|uniref:protein SGT1 homolog n=1 Tax=Saimiri boliviensis TaxID=27679 RepID=UPI003D770F8B